MRYVILSLLACLTFLPDAVYSQGSKKFDYFYLEGIRLKEKEEHNAAFNAFQHALTIDSTSSAALYEIAHYYLYLNKPQEALKALESAVAYNDKITDYKVALAALYREVNQLDKAINLYEALAKDFPEKIEIYFYLSELYIQVQQIDKAIASLDNLENNIGLNENISIQKYHLYKILDKRDKALREIEKLAEKFPLEARYPIIIGDFYLENGNSKKALDYYDKAYALNPNSPFYYLSMSNYYDLQGDEEAVFKEIEKALLNSSMEVDVKLDILGKYISYIFEAKKDKELVNSLLNTLLEQHPQEIELHQIYAEFLLTQNNLSEAKFHLKLVAEAQPEYRKTWSQLLNIALQSESYDEVVVICDQALRYFPDSVEFLYYKGLVLSIQEKYSESLPVLLKAVESNNDKSARLLSICWGLIGDIYYQLGEIDKSFDAFDEGLKHSESNVGILNNYAYFLSERNQDLDKAESMSAKTIQIEPNNPTYLDTYAWILYKKGNFSLAKFYIERAIATSPKDNISEDIQEHYNIILESYETIK